jgi:hypothetical protein
MKMSDNRSCVICTTYTSKTVPSTQPGVTTFQATISGGHITATRPKHFFRDDGDMPEVVSLAIARPHGFQDHGQTEWANLVTQHVRAREADHRQRRAEKGVTVLGRDRILWQSPFHGPESHAPRFQMSPRVAAKSKWARIEVLLRNRSFVEKYRAPSWATWPDWPTSCFPSAPTGCASSARSPAKPSTP